MNLHETININDKRGFVYEVEIKYCPKYGFATASYKGSIISDVQSYKITEPFGDIDREWEQYEESLLVWRDEILAHFQHSCAEFLNTTYIE